MPIGNEERIEKAYLTEYEIQSAQEWYRNKLLECGVESCYCTEEIIKKVPSPYFPKRVIIKWDHESLKAAVINHLVSTNGLTGKQAEMMRFYHYFQSLDYENVGMKLEFEKKFNPEEIKKIPELENVITKEFVRAINQGFLVDNHNVGIDTGKARTETIPSPNAFTSSIPHIGIGFINGINNEFTESANHAAKLFEYTGHLVPIQLCYNSTYSAFCDAVNFLYDKASIDDVCEPLLLHQWAEFFILNGPKARFLQIGHSGGVAILSNALEKVPPEIRGQMSVLAIAPGAIIKKNFCFEAEHYICINDPLPYLANPLMDYSQIVEIPSAPDAKGFDHAFSSPTYENILRMDISSFIDIWADTYQEHYPFRYRPGMPDPWQYSVYRPLPGYIAPVHLQIMEGYNEAVICFKNKDYASTISLCAKALELFQNAPPIHAMPIYQSLSRLRAQCYYLTEKYDLCLDDFNKIYDKNERLDCHFRGVVNYRLGNIESAKMDFKNAANLGDKFSKDLLTLLC